MLTSRFPSPGVARSRFRTARIVGLECNGCMWPVYLTNPLSLLPWSTMLATPRLGALPTFAAAFPASMKATAPIWVCLMGRSFGNFSLFIIVEERRTEVLSGVSKTHDVASYPHMTCSVFVDRAAPLSKSYRVCGLGGDALLVSNSMVCGRRVRPTRDMFPFYRREWSMRKTIAVIDIQRG